MLEKSWPEISKGLGKELEVFSASDVRDSVKLRPVEICLRKPVFLIPIQFRYGFHILTFPEIEVMGSYLEKLSASNIQDYVKLYVTKPIFSCYIV